MIWLEEFHKYAVSARVWNLSFHFNGWFSRSKIDNLCIIADYVERTVISFLETFEFDLEFDSFLVF